MENIEIKFLDLVLVKLELGQSARKQKLNHQIGKFDWKKNDQYNKNCYQQLKSLKDRKLKNNKIN